ncbi:MAG: two-component system response regulator [Cytophagaceae bacterium]
MINPELFIVVDDDPVNNMLCECILKTTFQGKKIKLFTDPAQALEYIKHETGNTKVLLLLDINMPEMTGWEFLDVFATYPTELRENYQILILTSSVDTKDKELAATSPLVKGFLSKPLEREELKKFIK